MPDITATDAARSFADLLDSVVREGKSYRVIRRGKAVATIGPVTAGKGSEAKALLSRHAADDTWQAELADLRSLVTAQERF